MKRLILSLAAMFSLFFLAENAMAQPFQTTNCSDYPYTKTITFTAPNGCTGQAEICCKTMEGGYEPKMLITKVTFNEAIGCDWTEMILTGEYMQYITNTLMTEGCDIPPVIMPCDEKNSEVLFSLVNSMCVRLDYEPGDDRLTFTYDKCRMDGGYCYKKYKVCYDPITGQNQIEKIYEESGDGECEEFQLNEIFEQMRRGEAVHTDCGKIPCTSI